MWKIILIWKSRDKVGENRNRDSAEYNNYKEIKELKIIIIRHMEIV